MRRELISGVDAVFCSRRNSSFARIKRFSNDCRNTPVTIPTNHSNSKQRNEPIRIPSNYLWFARSAGKITLARGGWFWFCPSLVEIFMEFANRSYRNRVINFDGHLKTALSCYPLRESRKELVSKEKFVGPPVTSERPYSHCVFHMVGLGWAHSRSQRLRSIWPAQILRMTGTVLIRSQVIQGNWYANVFNRELKRIRNP